MKAASLNHIYRLVWSRLQQAWVAVAETARAQGKSSVSGKVPEPASGYVGKRHIGAITSSAKRGMLVASAFAAVIAPLTSFADTNVVAGVVAGDLAVKDLSSTHTQYTHTANVNIVDFYKFGVEKGHQLDVVMPDAGRALYRVIGDSRSEIMGTLNSNGSLFLINQNGILFGHGAEVNVGNIVASSLDISNDDFIKGKYNFAVGSIVGNVENYGVIKAKNEGYIVLLGKTVDNSGTLVASNGSVVLGSAQQATLDFFGNGLVKTKLSGGALEATIKNSGSIYADGGFVQMATNARASAINISGIVEANQLVERNGVIRLEGGDNAKVEVSGRLIAKGLNTTGGTIEVTGEQVALMNGAVLDASGDKGGGKVLVGGDYQGKNDAVYNARTTYVASGATIKADAIQEGNGGKVVVWADDLTRYYGEISAQGGAKSGNGGFVEVSGKQHLAMLGDVNVGAANGIGGSILFDPENITLDNTAPTPLTDQATGTPDVAFADNSGVNTVINISNVQGFTELFLQANNDITVKSPVSMNLPNGSIRMEANNNINVNANIQSGPIGSISLIADKDGKNGGDININANITSGSEGIFLSAANITQTTGNINTTGNIFNGIAGSVKMEAKGGDINLGNANINAAGVAVGPGTGANGGNVEIKANSLTMTGNINTSGSVSNQTLGSGGQGGVVTINTVNNITVGSITTSAGDAGSTSASSTLSGDVTLASSAGNITTGNVNANGGINNLGAKVTMNAAGEIKTGDINTSAGVGRSDTDGKSARDINITAGTSLTVGKVTASGADGNGTNKSGGVAGAVNLVATTGDVTFGGITNNAGAKTGTGVNGNSANIFVSAGKDIIQKGNIVTTSNSADAVTMVAAVGYKNTNNFDISTGSNGRWLIYSQSPDVGQRGSKILNGYDFKQYGTSYDAVKSGSQQINAAAKGNGLIYSETIVIDPKVSGTATKVYDTTTDASIAGLDLVKEGRDNDVINYSKLVSATYDNKNVGDNKVVTTNPVSIVSVTNTGFRNGASVVRQVYGYTLTNNQTSVAATGAVGKITPATVSTVAGITANDKVFDGNTLASLNTGAAIFNGRLGNDQLTVATADGQFIDSAVGAGKTVNISGITLGGVDAGNYTLVNNTATTTASILAVPTPPTTPTTTTLNISPRDNAGLGGLVGTNPALNTMTIVSLNPAAGDDDDPDAVACPVNEDHLGSTPILSSGVKLPDGVNSNCI